MDARLVILCAVLSMCLARNSDQTAQMGQICAPTERLLSCGCAKTCRDPVPNCKGVCKEGCFCEDGQVRNDRGECVPLAKCPPIPSPYKLETSEPRIHGGSCPDNEEYRFCEPCNRSCDNPNPICPAQCASGCFCKGDLLRDKDGKCVKFEKCSNFLEYIREREKNVFAPIPYRFSCGPHQQYSECQKCTQTCSDPEPVCGKCRAGCFCKEGFVKGPDGKCLKREECPTAATFLASLFSSMEECSSGEEFSWCGWCEASCRSLTPRCPAGCTRGCQCQPPRVRHANGRCVARDQCPGNCTDPNEEYSCLFGCERSCHPTGACLVLRYPLRCLLGCHCKRGYYRNGKQCVKDCSRNNAVIVVQ